VSGQSPEQSRKSIFISYRRDDSQDVTGRIYDRLLQQFSPDSIFKDVDTIPIGVDFREHLEQEIMGCQILLAIVGPSWTSNERLKDEGDLVRIEIEYGLDNNRDILVVPVLVGNALMPSAEQLPDSLKEFAFRNAIPVRPDPDFHRDMDKLIKSLSSAAGKDLATTSHEAETAPAPQEPYEARKKSIKLKAIAEQTDVLCETIVSQSGFKKLHSKIEAFMNDEKLKYEYGLLNERGGLLQQKQEHGVEIKPEEFEEFEKMREEFMANPVATAFLEAQEEVQDIQNRIYQHLAKSFELGRKPDQGDFDFCSDGFGNCGCEE